MFNKIDGFIKIYDGTSYLVLFDPEKFDVIYNRIRYLINLKCSITYFFFHYDAKIKDDSNDSLSTEKTLTLHVMTLIKSALNKDQNHYYYNIFT